MAKIDPRDFLLNTDYEMDKIIYCNNFEWTVSAVTTEEIPHKLRTVPLIFGVWSTNADFTDCKEIGQADNPWEQGLRVEASSDMTKIKFTLNPKKENGAYVSTTFYIKAFGFEPGSNWYDSHLDKYLKLVGQKIPTTSKYAKAFILNTDYNYLKLLRAGKLGEWTNNHYEYTHNLGYVPQILAWSTLGPQGELGIENIEFTVSDGSFNYEAEDSVMKSGIYVDNTKVYQYTGWVPNFNELRIYADEA